MADAYRSDGNIRYYEYEHDKFEYLSEYKSGDPQRGIAFMPKRGVNLHQNEVTRVYKTVNDSYIEPISFVVPRRAEVFQTDIYPPATGTKPALSGDDYFAGKETALPPKISLESLYEGEEPVEIPAERAPKATEVKQTPAPAVTSSAKTDPQSQSVSAPSQPEPSQTRAPAPSSLNDNKASMSNMASRFADQDGEGDSDDASSFEEIQKPVERPHASMITRQEEKTGVRTPPQANIPSPTKTTSAPAPEEQSRTQSRHVSADTTETPVRTTTTPSSAQAAGEAERDPSAVSSVSSPTSGAKGAAEGIRGVMQDIKSMLAQQGKEVAAQGEKIEILAREVASLKARLGE